MKIITIDERLYSHFFTEVLEFSEWVGWQIGSDCNLVYINYYYFNVLLNITRTQNTKIHQLNDEFFNELSAHKKKIYFSGNINEDKTEFRLNKVIYNYQHNKLGLYVKKRITSNFMDRGFKITLSRDLSRNNFTVFLLDY